ncbi:MAG: prepilin-type N-terminal cleavage/methylation domain-containing protein [Candidatus Falkowbacteria bacterium]
MKKIKGFTLIELLIVIAIIAALSALAFVALNPLARFQDSRNAQRWNDVKIIAEAIKLQQIDNQGVYDDAILDLTERLVYQIGEDDAGNCGDTCLYPTVDLEDDCVDLDSYLSADYLQEIPIDPNDPDADYNETRYYLIKNENDTITVGVCSEELGSNEAVPEIMVTR